MNLLSFYKTILIRSLVSFVSERGCLLDFRSRASPECDFYGGNKGLVYITVIRPDIAYAVHVVSQFVSASTGPRRGVRRHSLGNSAEDHTGHR